MHKEKRRKQHHPYRYHQWDEPKIEDITTERNKKWGKRIREKEKEMKRR